MEGYIKLYRKLRENSLWLEPRRFSKAEAWIDLLLRASHKDRDVVLGMDTIHLKAGEFITSQMKLAEAWGWNRETVKIFLDLLQSSNQASYKSSNKNTIVSLRKWDIYQGSNPATEPTTKRHQIQQQGDNRSSTINNDNNDNNVKNDKNDKEICTSSPWYLELKNDFKGIDVDYELVRFKVWLKDNVRPNPKKAFRNWLLNCKPGKDATSGKHAGSAKKDEGSKYSEIPETVIT